jgi:hypothetical protein
MLQNCKHYARIGATVIALLGAGAATPALADDMGMGMKMGSIMIMSPKDGATLSAMGENKMEYEIKLGAGDDHFHVWVDGEKSGPQRELKGNYTLPKMMPGKHAIIVKIVDKAHVPTGVEKSVFVKVE